MATTGLRHRLSRSQATRAGLCVVALIVVAEGAVLLLSPSEEGIPPDPIDAGEYFSPERVAEASDYRSGQTALFLGGLAAQLVVVGLVATGRPRRVRELLAGLDERRVLGTMAAGALVVVLADVASLPTSIAAHERSVDAGLSTQSLGPWLGDHVKSVGIGVVLGALGAAALCGLIRRLPRAWWAPGAVLVVGYGAAMSLLAPIVIAPQFNDFEELPEASKLRADVIGLGERAGVDVGEVFRVDASRRSTTLNAYVAGIGPTKRVVLYDNLIDATTEPELESVVAHELGHQAHSDIPRGILFAAIVTPLGLVLVRELSGAIGRRTGATPGYASAVPALFLAIGIVMFGVNVPANQLSREVEASADAFALRITDDPQALIDLQLRLNSRNLSDPEPPGWSKLLFGSHPSTAERIGSAVAWERGVR